MAKQAEWATLTGWAGVRALTLSALMTLALASCAHVAVVRDGAGGAIPLEVSGMERVTLNGTEQWIYIAGSDRDNPVLLWLDGGPGGSEVGWVRKYLGPLHRSFTVVCWDQRGTARSWGAVADKSSLRAEDYVADAIELSRILAARFGGKKIYLVGHSWGSIVGLRAAAREPSLYAAYVGVGQQINGAENDRVGWEMVHSGALARGKADVARRLEKNGLPPYGGGDEYLYLFSRLYEYSPRPAYVTDFDSMDFFRASEHSLVDRVNLLRGLANGVKVVYPQVGDLDFEREIPSLGCPLFIVNGRYDFTCVATIAARWFESVDAPLKELAWFENSGHNPCYTESDRFMGFMVDTVLARTLDKSFM